VIVTELRGYEYEYDMDVDMDMEVGIKIVIELVMEVEEVYVMCVVMRCGPVRGHPYPHS
jgi:hypothetical protein